MNKPLSIGRIRLFPTLVLLLICGDLGLAFFFISSSPFSDLIFSPLTPTQENLWAFVDLPKATYTPTSLYSPTITPTATETPGVMDMQDVANTAVPIVPTNAPMVQQTQSVPVYSGAKYILVDISEQHIYVYEG